MKRRVWIGSIVLISVLFCSYFVFNTYLESGEIKAKSLKTEESIGSDKAETVIGLDSDMLEENYCFISEKTVVKKEELKQSKGILKFTDSEAWKEYQNYKTDKELAADYNSEYKYGSKFFDKKAEQLMPSKSITLEGYQDICIEGICNNRMMASFQISLAESESDHLFNNSQNGSQSGLLIYDIKEERALISILPEDRKCNVVSSLITENYLYWCEAYWEENSFDSQSVWEVKGMDLNTQRVFCICKSEDFKIKNGLNVPMIGSCNKDDLYFYFEYPQEEVNQYPGYAGFESVRDTAYQLDLMCYKPKEDSFDKKAEFYFRYNNNRKPCIEGNFVYTVEYDGENWYILEYHLLSDTYCHYRIELKYKTEYIQNIHACSEYMIYETSFGRKFLLDFNTLEVREFTEWASWRDIAGNKVFFRKNDGWDYCYDIIENRYYKLLKREYDFGCTVVGNNREYMIFDKKENKVYLFSYEA